MGIQQNLLNTEILNLNNQKTSLAAIICTFNEEIHLLRCISSLKKITSEIYVIDSYSTDRTKEIAISEGVIYIEKEWTTFSIKFNWAINNCNIKAKWVMRIDADEYVTNELANNLIEILPTIKDNINGIRVKRLMYFLDQPLKKGGMYPIWHLKIWRNGFAYCEEKWMDERMKLTKGETIELQGDIIDHNLNNSSWWTQKHNGYATKEAIDDLNILYNFNNGITVKPNFFGKSEERRRYLKLIYLKLPLFVRPFIFFIIRYFIQGGILEGKNGLIWCVLQAFWYRFLIDLRIYEVFKKTKKDKYLIIEYFKNEYKYDITKF